jgi:hypothetical protein
MLHLIKKGTFPHHGSTTMKKAAATVHPVKRCTCKQVFRQMCDTLGADLGSPECEAMRAHVKDCPNCTAYLASLKSTVDLYGSYPTPKLTLRATKTLLKTIAQQATSR